MNSSLIIKVGDNQAIFSPAQGEKQYEIILLTQ